MPFSLFGGLEAGKRALLSHQYELTTIGHNISNADTRGYTRQRVMLETTPAYISTDGKYGTGVRIATVQQTRDMFLSMQYREENGSRGFWDSMERTMSQVENVLLEPTDNALNDMIGNFFNAWQQLTTAADSQTARSTLREQAQLLINGFRQNAQRLDSIIGNLDEDVSARVTEINEIASTVAQINRQIAFSELDGNTANDLRDLRDRLIDDLSGLVDVRVLEQPTGAVRVFIGAMEFVGTDHYRPLETKVDSTATRVNHTVIWQGSQIELKNFGGELQALIEARDEVLPEFISRLDNLAASLVREVNAIHRTGYGANNQTGINFFNPQGLTAATIDLSQDIKNDVSAIAASSAANSPGNNITALAIAELKSALTLENNSSTFNEYYASLVGLVGVRARQATDSKENFNLVVDQLEFARQSVQGVSLDEEMANIIRAQHAYDAAAKVITTIDQAIGTIINELGVGGR